MNKLIILFFLIFFDFITKYFVKSNLILNQQIKINKFIDIVYVQNYGVSFGLFSDILSHWILILIGLSVVLFISYLMFISNKKLEKLAYFIIITGAFGNILDRYINTYVVDFISLHYNNFYWPAFNLADIYITIGIIMLILSFFVGFKESK